jgi:hypothetical protein
MMSFRRLVSLMGDVEVLSEEIGTPQRPSNNLASAILLRRPEDELLCHRHQDVDGNAYYTGFAPVKAQIDAKKAVAWCGCKHSKSKPFCDGSHSRL